MQNLILPINNARVTAGYKSKIYAKTFKTEHYGIDYVSLDGNTSIYSPGKGIVVSAGMDGKSAKDRCGMCLVIIFPDVIEAGGTRTRGVACRMFHLADIAVLPGQMVQQGQLLGHYGKTGAMVTGEHLHMELDYDIAYPQFSYGVSSGGFIIKAGTVESSIPPHRVIHRGENQSIMATLSDLNTGWVAESELQLAEYVPEGDTELDPEYIEKLEQLLGISKWLCKRHDIPA